MKHADLRAGQRVGYRWPAFVTHTGGPVAEAEIVDPAWRVPLDYSYEGEKVRAPGGSVGGTLILYRLPGQRPELRATAGADRFVSPSVSARQRRAEHFEREGIALKSGGPPAVVALMVEGSGTAWQPATAAIGTSGKLLVRVDGADLVDVDPRRLRGPSFLKSEDDRRKLAEARKAERDRRTALKAETAARLGLGDDAVSLGEPTWDGSGWRHQCERPDEVVLVVTPGALAGLVNRALSDPAWAEQLQGEGVLDALAALGGI